MQISVPELTDRRPENKPGWHFSDGEFAFQSLEFRMRWKIDTRAMTFSVSSTTCDGIRRELDKHIHKYRTSGGRLSNEQLSELSDLFGFCSRGIFSFRAAHALVNKLNTPRRKRNSIENNFDRDRIIFNCIWLKHFLEKWNGLAPIKHLDWSEGPDIVIYADADCFDKARGIWGRAACCFTTGEYFVHKWPTQCGEIPSPDSSRWGEGLILFQMYNVMTAALTLGSNGSKVVVVSNPGPFQDGLRGRQWKEEFTQAFIYQFDFECGMRNMSVRFERVEGTTEQLYTDHVSCCGKKEYLSLTKALGRGEKVQNPKLKRQINSMELAPLFLSKHLARE